MKKSLLALAVLGAFAGAASAQTNVTIYGVVDAGIFRTDNGASTNETTWGVGSGMQSGSRLGFRGTEDLGGGLSAIFTLESGFNIDDGSMAQSSTEPAFSRLFGRQAFVGLTGGFGTVKLGRQYTPLRAAVESVDPFGLGLAGNASNVINLYGERTDNTINYTSANMGGFVGQAAYSFGEIAGENSAGRHIGLSGSYNNGPIRAVLAYHAQERLSGGSATVAPTTLDGEEDTIMVGAAYDFGVAKLHAAYVRNEGETQVGAKRVDRDDAMIGVSAPVGAGTLLASYIRRSDDMSANNDVSQWAIGYTYALSKRTNVYTSYARIKNDGTETRGFGSNFAGKGNPTAGNDPSIFNVGVRHTF